MRACSSFLLSCILCLVIGSDFRPNPQLHFPIEDVVRNARQFVLNVKRATGNLKDAVAEAEAKAQKGKNSSKSVKPGAYLVSAILAFFSSIPCFTISSSLFSCTITSPPTSVCELLGVTLVFGRIFSLLFTDSFFLFLDQPVYLNTTVLQFALFHS